jgi:hypothetical protein
MTVRIITIRPDFAAAIGGLNSSRPMTPAAMDAPWPEPDRTGAQISCF